MSILFSSLTTVAASGYVDPASYVIGIVFLFIFVGLPIMFFIAIIENLRSKKTTRPKSGSRSPRNVPLPTKRDIKAFHNGKVRIFGTPGAGLKRAGHFSETNIKNGVAGEVKTADIVAQFIADTSETYAFHSLIWPMSSTKADVDHAIVCGDNVIFIDSKNWTQKGVYAFDWSGNITVNNRIHRYGKEPKIIPARQKYHDYLKKIFGPYHSIDVTSVIVIHNDGASLGAGAYGRFNYLATGDNLYAFLMNWRLSLGIVEDNQKLLASIKACLK